MWQWSTRVRWGGVGGRGQKGAAQDEGTDEGMLWDSVFPHMMRADHVCLMLCAWLHHTETQP